MAVDAAGNLLVPMDWRGVLVRRGDVPVARLLQGTATVSAFPDREVPLHLADARLLGSFSVQGTRLPPLLSVQGALIPEGLALFGSADAPEGVLRIGRGATCPDGASCRDDRDCAEGRCEGAFDFSSRAFSGVGPVALQDGACLGGRRDRLACAANADCPEGSCVTLSAAARDPVPLDGFVETDPGYAFVVSESLVQEDRNGDGDTLDDVVQLVDRESGAVLPASPQAPGSAIARIHEAPFSRPALAVGESLVAFLEPEPAAAHIDRNGDGDAADTILRVLRVEQGRLVDLGPDPAVVADAAPLIDGAPLAVSDGLVVFRTPEAFAARRRTGVFTVGAEGPLLEHHLDEFAPLSVSDDGRWVALVTWDQAGRADDTCALQAVECEDAFLLDRDADGNGRFDDAPVIAVARASDGNPQGAVSIAAISGDGRVVAFVSSASTLVPDDGNGLPDAFVWDRITGVVERVSVDGNGREVAAGVVGGPRSLALSHDGQVVAFVSRSGDLVLGDANGVEDVFGRDRRTGTTERVSVATDGSQGDARSFVPKGSAIALSADGTRVAFDSEAATLVPEDRNEVRDVFVHDRVAGWTRRVSVGVEGEPSGE